MDCGDEEYGESFNKADIDAYPFALEVAAPPIMWRFTDLGRWNFVFHTEQSRSLQRIQ
jgi:hypothetical protein